MRREIILLLLDVVSTSKVCSMIGHQSATLYSVFSGFFKPVVLSSLWPGGINNFKLVSAVQALF